MLMHLIAIGLHINHKGETGYFGLGRTRKEHIASELSRALLFPHSPVFPAGTAISRDLLQTVINYLPYSCNSVSAEIQGRDYVTLVCLIPKGDGSSTFAI